MLNICIDEHIINMYVVNINGTDFVMEDHTNKYIQNIPVN